MPSPLQQRMTAIRQQVVAVQTASAWGWTLGTISAAALFAGCLDAALRLRHWPLRVLLTVAVIAIAVWAVRRWLVPWWQMKYSDVQVARRLELLHPRLGERLSSALAFLQQGTADPKEGSLELRFAVVAEAESIAGDLPLESSVDRQPRQRALMLCGVLSVIALGLLVWQPANFSRAALRLVNPITGPVWPPRHKLELVLAPTAVALGESFEVQVVDRNGRPPADAAITLQFDQPTHRKERHPLQQRGDKLVFRVEQVLTGFRYRVTGGDDDSHDWQELLVVQPPKLSDIVSDASPPAYSGIKAYRGGRLIKLLAGSKLNVSGVFDRAVGSIKLTTQSGEALPQLTIAQNGLSFHSNSASAVWTPTKAQQVWIELTGSEAEGGLVSREGPLELQVIADAPPSISWDQPGDHSAFTTQALVPISAGVKDDLAVQRVELRFAAIGSEAMTPQIVVLFEQAQAPVKTLGEGDSRTVTHAWDLAQLPATMEGTAYSIQLAAVDFHGQETLSSPRRISLISTQDLQHRLVQRQGAILEQLGDVLRLQRQARGLIGEIAARQADEGKWQPRDLDVLQSADLQQRQVQRLLKSPDDGLARQVELLLAELAANRLGDEGIATRMQALQKQIRRLNHDVLPPLEEQLSTALKTARLRSEDTSNCADDGPLPLEGVTAHQDLAVSALESMLGELAQWDSFSRIAREVGLLKQEQQKIRDQSEGVRLAIALAQKDTEPQNAAKQAAQRQLEAARQFDKLQQRMDALLTKLQDNDPLAAGSLAAALEAAQRLAIGGQMRSAARQLQDIKPGDAVKTQDIVSTGLSEVLDRLASRRDQDARRTLAALNAAAEELNRLGARNENLAREATAAAAANDPQKRQLQRLTKEAQRLAEEVAELARKLQRLKANGANETVQRAAQSLSGGSKSAAGGDGAAAEAQAKSALEDLKQAREQLQQAIQQAQADLVREELARLETELAGLLKRQQNLLAETQRLEESKQKANGKRPNAQVQTLRDLAEEQRQLADAVQQSSETFSSGDTFDLALAGVQQVMQRAHRWLLRGQTDAAPQTAQQQAIDRLKQLLAAARSPATDLEQEQPMEQGPQQQGDGPPQVRSLGELQLLAQLQQEINRRTIELEAAREKAGDFTAEQLTELQELAAEQGKLAEIVLKLVQKPAEEANDIEPLPPDKKKPPEPKKPGNPLDDDLLKDLK
jgi:hypothetical protein